MQKKINYNEIYCVVKNYDAIFKNLRSVSDIFAERYTRGNMLVWDCPGDGWQSLDKADTDTAQKVATQLETHKQSIKGKFGEQESHTVDKIFQTPGDNCIFYKIDQNGNLKIKLTAWGYMLPVCRNGSDTSGGYNPHVRPGGVPLSPIVTEEPKKEEHIQQNEVQSVVHESKKSEPATDTESPKDNPSVDDTKTETQEKIIQNNTQPTSIDDKKIEEEPKDNHDEEEKTHEDAKEHEKKEIKPTATTVVIKEENTTDFSWRNFLIILGLIAMTVGTYYVCCQII